MHVPVDMQHLIQRYDAIWSELQMSETLQKPSELLEPMSASALLPLKQLSCSLVFDAVGCRVLSSDRASSAHAGGLCLYRAEEWWTYQVLMNPTAAIPHHTVLFTCSAARASQ